MANDWSVDWGVTIGGVDVSSGWRSVLQSITVNDQAGQSSDSCDMVLDDTDGQIRIPSKRSPVEVSINGVKVFGGFVQKTESSGGRSSGRLLKVKASGVDTGGKAKEPQSMHMDDADLGTFLGDLAKKAGLDISVDPDLAKIAQDYWAADGESFLAIGQKLASRFGGTFKIRGNKVVLAKAGVAGLGICRAAVGDNLLDWNITPREPRGQFTAGRARWFDRASGMIKSKELPFGIDDIPAVNALRSVFANEDEADAVLDGQSRETDSESGSGSVTLTLALDAVVEGQCQVVGAREGVDGLYTISTVAHKTDRSGGATTTLQFKKPEGGAGKDNRKAGEAAQKFSLPTHETLG